MKKYMLVSVLLGVICAGSAVAGDAPVVVSIANPSFETPAVTGGWWSTNLPASFGWTEKLGKYSIGKASAGHFTQAAEGAQALCFGPGASISQDVGPTEAGKFHTLTFSLLQTKRTPDAGASLKAEIYDGNNLRTANVCKVPAAGDVWETYSITAAPLPTPSGQIIIKFTGISGTPWLDNVVLTSSSTAPAGSTNKTTVQVEVK